MAHLGLVTLGRSVRQRAWELCCLPLAISLSLGEVTQEGKTSSERLSSTADSILAAVQEFESEKAAPLFQKH